MAEREYKWMLMMYGIMFIICTSVNHNSQFRFTPFSKFYLKETQLSEICMLRNSTLSANCSFQFTMFRCRFVMVCLMFLFLPTLKQTLSTSCSPSTILSSQIKYFGECCLTLKKDLYFDTCF